MKIAVIDIGSNSVRLMLWADGKTLYKTLKTTRLGEGLSFSPRLSEEACLRTAQAVAEFCKEAEKAGAERVYAFATAAVRSAENREEFTEKVKQLCGLEVDVIDGVREAEIGLYGALGKLAGGQCGCDGQCDCCGIIDVGGASTEVTVRKDGAVAYAQSVNIGTVRILDVAGRDLIKIDGFIGEKLNAFAPSDLSAANMYAVGGTASRLASLKLSLKEYDASAIDGTQLTYGEVRSFAERLTAMSVGQIRAETLLTKSADLIGGGAALLAAVMKYFDINKVTVSESDNLEGYLQFKLNQS